jgi:hypothetical protein
MRPRDLVALLLLFCLPACGGPGHVVMDGERLDIEKTKVRERVPSEGWFQLELIAEADPDWAPAGTRKWVPSDRAAVRLSLPSKLETRTYNVGKDCWLEVLPRASGLRELLGEELPWVPAPKGIVTIEDAGETVKGRFSADTTDGPVDGEFRVKRRLL